MENPIAKLLKVIGIIEMIMGVILGLFLANSDIYGSTNVPIFILWSIVGFVSGMFFIGFAEIINLLHGIHTNIVETNTQEKNDSTNTQVNMKGKSKYDVYKEVMNKGN